MDNNLPSQSFDQPQPPSQSFRKPLIFFLFFLCFVFSGFIIYTNFFSRSILVKEKPSPIPKEQEGDLVVETEYKDGRVVSLTSAESCSKLLKVISSQILDQGFSLSSDVNHDGKIDLDDIGIVDSKINDEKWCQEMLNQK